MIATECFTKAWIDGLRKSYPEPDPGILEKTIYAFELLGILTRSGIPFIFKGGTALMLHIPEIRRLSIDIDIIGDIGVSELRDACHGTIFDDIEEDKRKEGKVPKHHFMVFYDSPIQRRRQNILLDVINIENPYAHIIEKPIRSDFFKVEEELTVRVPTLEGLLGDKLAAFAPDTVGVPYGTGKSMEIIKQLFDVGNLFEHAKDFSELRLNHRRLYEVENTFRNDAFSYGDVLDDTIHSGYLLCQLNLRKSIRNEKTEELKNGIQQIRSHLIDRSFNLSRAKVFAARAAYLATAMKEGSSISNPFKKHFAETTLTDIANLEIEGTYSNLNRLKPILPEAFYYWHLISRIEQSQGIEHD